MIRQDIFNQVCAHLITQGKPALNKGACAYRGEWGTRCAVGFLVEDEEYRSDFEGKTVDGLKGHTFAKFDIEDEDTVLLLCSLQYAHDMAEYRVGEPIVWLESCKKRLRRTAEKFNLEVPDIIKE